MAVEAPLSKYKKDNYRIGIAVLVVFGILFAYDGYLSQYEWSMRQSFYKEHVLDNDGVPDGTMQLNRSLPPVFAVIAALLAVRLVMVRGRRITAGDEALILPNGKTIAYDRIEQIDKTHFDSKGFFVVTYKTDRGAEANLRLTSRAYDNMPAILDVLTAKITGQSA
ncbi:MAG: hypothetical protein IH624_10740 [Phycisphaerae bacterium]|nr:hypothetical protein [Phycisphaerae bacterium]